MTFFETSPEFLAKNTINSNRVYGTAIFSRGGVKLIHSEDSTIEAWIGGLDGKMIEGGGSRRRVTFSIEKNALKWNCTGNPKNHQIFCKHCVALALYINNSIKTK